ncbi:DUF5994 family protein [Streptomyces sp. NPDC001056]
MPRLLGSLDPDLGIVAPVTVDRRLADVPQKATLPGRVIEVVPSAVDAEVHAVALDRDPAGHREMLVIRPGESRAAATWFWPQRLIPRTA